MGEWTLRPNKQFPGVSGPVVVCVMDGVGIGRQDESDAVWLARTPTLDWLAREAPTGMLRAHGKADDILLDERKLPEVRVGDGIGNSRTGHHHTPRDRNQEDGTIIGAPPGHYYRRAALSLQLLDRWREQWQSARRQSDS